MKNLLGYPKMLEEAKNSKKPHSWIVELLIFVLVLIVSSNASSIPVAIGTVFWIFSGGWLTDSAFGFSFSSGSLDELLGQMPSWLTLISLFATVITTVIAVLYCTALEKRKAASMGFRKSHNGREYVIGASIGLLLISAVMVIGLLTRAYSICWASPDPVLLVLFLLGYILQGMSEEVLCRGYLMVSMTRKTPVWICVILSSLVFAALHLSNPGISFLAFFNLFLFGVIAAVYIIKRGNIWGACALHSFWNFYQGCIYGVSVSGTGAAEGSVYLATQAQNMDLWSGGQFGIEGGLCTTIIEVLFLLILLFLIPKSKEEQYVAPVPETPVMPEAADIPETGNMTYSSPASETADASYSAPVSETAGAPYSAPVSETAGAPYSAPVSEVSVPQESPRDFDAAWRQFSPSIQEAANVPCSAPVPEPAAAPCPESASASGSPISSSAPEIKTEPIPGSGSPISSSAPEMNAEPAPDAAPAEPVGQAASPES